MPKIGEAIPYSEASDRLLLDMLVMNARNYWDLPDGMARANNIAVSDSIKAEILKRMGNTNA